MERGTLPEELAGVDMNSLIEMVLPSRAEKYMYIQEFREKMTVEGISTPSDLIRVPKELLEEKLSTQSGKLKTDKMSHSGKNNHCDKAFNKSSLKGEQGSKSLLDLCVYWENTSHF